MHLVLFCCCYKTPQSRRHIECCLACRSRLLQSTMVGYGQQAAGGRRQQEVAGGRCRRRNWMLRAHILNSKHKAERVNEH